MATTYPDSGTGATLTLATSTFTASIVNVSELVEQVEALDTTHLGLASTANATKLIGDNPELQPLTVQFQFKADEALPRVGATTSENATLTLPLALSTNGTNFSVVITVFVSSVTLSPPLARNQINTGTMILTPTGADPTITAEAA